jgi:type I restriction enzyme S subunit
MSTLKALLKDVPVEWKTADEIFNIKNGYTPSKKISEYWANGTIPWFRMEDIRKNGRVITKATQHVSESAIKSNIIPANSLILSTTATLGEHALVLVPFITNQQITSFSLKDNVNLSIKFLFYLFFDFGKWCQENANKNGGLGIIGLDKLKKYKFPIPYPNDSEKSLEIQQEIVRVLDGLSEQNKALTSALAQEIDQRKKQYEYYREDLFRFEGKEVEWKTLGEVAENLDAMRKPVKSGSRDLGDIPYYGASGIVDYVKDYIFDGDFLLVSEDGANLLARSTPIAFSISGKSWVNNHAHILKFENQYHRKLVEYYLNSIDLEPYITGAAQPKLNQKNLNKIKVPVIVQELELERVVSLLDKYDEATKSIVAQLEKEIALRNKQYAYYRDLLLRFTKD